MLRVLDLPNRRQAETVDAFIPGSGPDPVLRLTTMAEQGIDWHYLDLNPFPLNPLARSGTFYAGIDPLRALHVLLFRRHVDVVCCGFESGLLLLVLLRRLFLFRPRLVMFEVNARGWPPRDRALDFIMPRLDGVLTLTDHQRQETDAAYRLRRPAQCVGFAVDDAFFHPLDLPDDGTIFSLGHDFGRDYATLLEACRPLGHPVVIRAPADNLPPGDHPGLTRLDRISFEALRDRYARARIVVVPLAPTSSPTGVTSILEAMAMGRPVIASDVGTTRDLVTDGVTGLVVPPRDPEALRQAIQRLMADPDLRDRLGRAARAAIEGPLSYRSHTRRFIDALHRIATPAPPAPVATPPPRG